MNFNLNETIWRESMIGLALIDPKTNKFIKANDKLIEVLEYSSEELFMKSNFDITHPQDAENDHNLHNKCIAGDIQQYFMAKRFITKTNKIVWVNLKTSLVKTRNSDESVFLIQVFPVAYTFNEEDPIATVSKKDGNVTLFIKGNWKWILGLVAGLIAVSYEFFYNFYTMQNIVEAQKERVQVIERKMNDQDKQLIKILEEISKIR